MCARRYWRRERGDGERGRIALAVEHRLAQAGASFPTEGHSSRGCDLRPRARCSELRPRGRCCDLRRARCCVAAPLPPSRPIPLRVSSCKALAGDATESARRECAQSTGGGGRLFSHLLGEPGATSFLLEGTIPYDKHAFLGYLSAQNRELPAGFCSAASAVALARAARDRAIALTKRIERWPDCAGVGATATIISHYPRRGGYRAHAAAADAFDTAHSYEHVMVKGARERQGEDAAVARLALRACAELAGVPEEVATTLRTHGIVLEPVESTNAVGEVANGVETVPVQAAVAPEAATARVWVPGVERPIVAPASLPEDALIVPWEPPGTTPPTLAADALRALGREGEEGDGPWIDPPAPVLFDAGPPDLDAAAATAAVPAMVGEGGAEKKMRSVSNWGVLELLEPVEVDAAAHRLALLVNRYPRATFALSCDAAFALTSNRDLVISMAAGGARFVVQEGAVEAAKRAWELPAPVHLPSDGLVPRAMMCAMCKA